MTFLDLKAEPTFNLTRDFPWVADAIQGIDHMVAENVIEPERLLEQYKKFESVLNTDKKALIKDLFEYKPPVVEEVPKVEEKKKEPVLATPRSDETSPPEGEVGEDGEPKAAEVVEEVEEEVPYVKPAGKQSLEDIRE
jgi:hypothetical protein